MDTTETQDDTLNTPNNVLWTKQIQEYKSLFGPMLTMRTQHDKMTQLPMSKLTSKALSGALRGSQIRSLCWRIFLGVLPESSKFSEWVQLLRRGRERYESLIEKHKFDPRAFNTAMEKEEDLLENNPLSQSEKNPWSQFFENTELEKVIDQDLMRLYPEYEFFRDEEVLKLMRRVLFLWSKLNPDTSYRQGMHELLAPFVLVFYRDAKAAQIGLSEMVDSEDESAAATLRELFDYKYLEHDCYLAFERLMIKMKEYFQVVTLPRRQQRDVTGLLDTNAEIDETLSKTPIHQICSRIQGTLLEKKDKELHNHLKSLDIEPQIYLLRWIRLLFGREFHLEDVLIIWDAIFADCGGFRNTEIDSVLIDLSLVEHISIMMLVYIRSQLLQLDYSSCLKRLMKYPPVEDVHMFVEQALQSRNNPNHKLIFHEPHVENHPLATNNNNNNSKKKASTGLFSKSYHYPLFRSKDSYFSKGSSAEPTPKAQPPQSPSTNSSLFTTTPKAQTLLHPSVGPYIEKELEMGNVLEKIIDILQNVVLVKDKPLDEDAFFMSIAELKHIRDVLKFQLPFENTSSKWIDEVQQKVSTESHHNQNKSTKTLPQKQPEDRKSVV